MVLNACVNFGVQEKSGSLVRGQKRGQNGSSEEPFGFSSKSRIRNLLILCMWIEVDSAFIMPETGPIHYFPFWSYGV